MKIRIRYSFEVPEVVPILAHWSTLEWLRHELPTLRFADRIATYAVRTDPDVLPVTLVAFDYELPVGMVSLKNNDLISHPQLKPWLAALYVVADYRGRGIGSLLHDAAVKKASELGYAELFLHTYQAAEMYRHRGWRVWARVAIPGGHEGELYGLSLTGLPESP
jgi:GNAT superfamily N-acetyltransferase